MPDGPGDFPFRITFAYLASVEDDGSDADISCVEFWLEQDVDSPEELAGADTEDVPLVTAAVLHDLAGRFHNLEAIAHAHLGAAAGVDHVSGARRRRELSDAFLRDVADRYRAHRDAGAGPVQALARERGVSRRTAGYWVQRAREAGHLEPRAEQKGD
jgi:hypothetical protein